MNEDAIKSVERENMDAERERKEALEESYQ